MDNKQRKPFFIVTFLNRILFLKTSENYFLELLSKTVFENVPKQALGFWLTPWIYSSTFHNMCIYIYIYIYMFKDIPAMK